MIAVSAATRPYPGEVENGDRWSVHRGTRTCRIAVIDGLGHGPEAAIAARAACDALAAHPDAAAVEALALCHRALVGTRGAAISIAVVDPGNAELTYAGVGNVEGRVWKGDGEQRLTIYRGIVGKVMPTVRPFTVALGDDWLLLMHTDGISSRFALSRATPLQGGSPQMLADRLLHESGKGIDDATMVVAAPR
ncbi:MAG: SpoIIE family protein phosphatase [Thermomicrobia bacterium]|nr:SpoIIE family protein phosphatase [Thermomicrobia bacterium]